MTPRPPEAPVGGRRPLAGLLLLALAVAAITVVVAAAGWTDANRLRDSVAGAGPLAPFVFALLFAVLTLAPWPKNVMSAAAGFLFGMPVGVLAVLAGANLGALVAFGLARALGRDAVVRWTGPGLVRAEEVLQRRGFLSVLVARLVPVVPFTIINYAAGLSPVRLRDYVLATLIGMLPGTVTYVALGAYGREPRSWEFAAALGALVALTAIGALWARRRRT